MSPFARSFVASAALHVVGVAAVVIAIVGAPAPMPTAKERAAPVTPMQLPRLVFLASPGPGGGGGGGGNKQPAPIRRAEAPGHDPLTLRVQRPVVPALMPPAEVPRETIAPVLLDAKPLSSGVVEQPGLPTGGVSATLSLGPGSGTGVGEGTGSGIGPGRGPGFGPGIGGGTGGGVYRAGGGVSPPAIATQVRPAYTNDALARRVQGSVELELVVTHAGLPSQIKVRRSLDSGLDQEAIRAVEQWRFTPGRLGGQPVDVWVTVILDFTIR